MASRRLVPVCASVALLGGGSCSLLWDPDERRSGEGASGIGGTFLDASSGGTAGVGGAGGSGGAPGGSGGSTDGGSDADGGCPAGFASCTTASGCETLVVTDPVNCGSCGRDCQGTACSDGKCAPVLLGTFPGAASGSSYVTYVRLHGGNLYAAKIGDGGDVYRVENPDSATPGSLTPLQAGYSAFDVMPLSNGVLFTTFSGTYALGAGPAQLLHPKGWSFGRDGDDVLVDGAVFAVAELEAFIGGAGGAPAPTSAFTSTSPSAARHSGVTCWTFQTPPPHHVRCSSWLQNLSSPALPPPYFLVMDGERVYWGTEPFTGTDGGLYSAPLNPAGQPTATPILEATRGVAAIALEGPSVYFAVQTLGSGIGEIQRAPRAGGTAEVLSSGYERVFGVAVDSTFVYYSADNAVYRVAR